MVTEYIGRDAMHKANRCEWDGVCGDYDGHQIFIDNENMIDSIPTADVRPVVRAKWVVKTGFIFNDLSQQVYCPVCKSYSYFYLNANKNFCPNCGADMREG